MIPPYRLGPPLASEAWRQVKLRTVLDCCKWDVQSEDHCVLADFPLLLQKTAWEELCSTAVALTNELAAAELELLGRPDLHVRLGVSKVIREELRKLAEPAPGVARVMRFDFHFTNEGWRISEVNADVPGGFIEGSGFTHFMAAHYSATTTPPDPARTYARLLADRLDSNAVVGMVHATAYSDDRQVMQFLSKCMAASGLRTILASPAHIGWEHGFASVSSTCAKQRLDAIVRFFPADWLPSLRNRSHWTPFFTGGRTPISNPATALLVQSKRFPLVWDDLSTNLLTWKALLPETRCPAEVPGELEEWVLKPAFGRVGEDIAIAGVTSERKLQLVHKAARRRPWEWVAQRRFVVSPVSHDNGNGSYYPTIGVFTIDGRVAGAYARTGRKPLIDDEAQDIAVLIAAGEGKL